MSVSQTQTVEQPKPVIQAPVVVVAPKPVKKIVQPVVKQEPVTVIGEAYAVAIGEPVLLIKPTTKKVCNYNLKLKRTVCQLVSTQPVPFKPVIN